MNATAPGTEIPRFPCVIRAQTQAPRPGLAEVLAKSCLEDLAQAGAGFCASDLKLSMIS